MMKIVVAGTTALFLSASPIANAQTSAPASPERLNAADRNNLADMRIDLAKAALQLTPEQEKNFGRLWRAPFVPERRIEKPVLQKSKKP